MALKMEHKLVVLGGKHAEKSALIRRFMTGGFYVDEYDLLPRYSYNNECFIDDEYVTLNIINTSGREMNDLIKDDIYSGEGFLLIYSVADRNSFEEIYKFYELIHRLKGREDVPMILVANSSELDSEQIVLAKEGEELAQQLKVKFMERNDKHRHVSVVFENLVRLIRNAQEE